VPPQQTVYVQQPPSRLNKAAAWVGIVAGSVFIVAVIFGTGFVVGKHSGGDGPRGHHGGNEMILHPGPPPFPMGPRGDFERGPGFPGPFGPGPMIDAPGSPAAPGSPTAPGGTQRTPAPGGVQPTPAAPRP
jgi:hypothetical protein